MEHVEIEDEKAMYDTMLKISKRVEIMYEALQKEIEEKERLQLQLRATEETLEELKHNNQNLQTDNTDLNMHLHEEKEEKHSLLLQLQAKDEALEKLQRGPCEVKSSFLMMISLFLKIIP